MVLRYERKYRLPNRGYQTILRQIQLHPASFRKQYPDRQINNVYFDTPELKTYHENIMGVPDRSKYRLRWYGSNIKIIDDPKFEIKTKHGELGYKVVTNWDGHFELNWSTLHQEVENRMTTGLTLFPTLVNSYQRSYFISSDGYYRLTIDRDITYYPVLKSQYISSSPIREEIIIIEIKYDQGLEKNADRIFRHIPFRQTKNSKYVNGVILTCG